MYIRSNLLNIRCTQGALEILRCSVFRATFWRIKYIKLNTTFKFICIHLLSNDQSTRFHYAMESETCPCWERYVCFVIFGFFSIFHGNLIHPLIRFERFLNRIPTKTKIKCIIFTMHEVKHTSILICHTMKQKGLCTLYMSLWIIVCAVKCLKYEGARETM